MKDRIKNRCLTDREIALFIDKRADSRSYERITGHLSSCDECLDKTLEVRSLLQAEKIEMPHELAERAFRKSSLEIGKSMFWKSGRDKAAAAAIAVAASLFIVVLAGVYNRVDLRDPQNVVVATKSLLEKKPADNSMSQKFESNMGYPAEAKKVLSRVHASKIGVKKQDFKNRPLMYAGYLYFLIMNSDKPDSVLLEKFSNEIAKTKLNSKNSMVMLKEGWFELFQKEISSLPEKELEQFSEGYIFSVLYHSDASGKVNSNTIEWGVKLIRYASVDEISDLMLYQSSGY
jgi:hypothetical protein